MSQPKIHVTSAAGNTGIPVTRGQKILVLGAGGKTGNATAMELLKKGEQVRAFVRRTDKRSEALKTAGAEIFQGELSNFEDISKALVGVDKAYFVAPWVADQMHIAATFAVAAAQSDLKLIVTITQWLGQPQHLHWQHASLIYRIKFLIWYQASM